MDKRLDVIELRFNKLSGLMKKIYIIHNEKFNYMKKYYIALAIIITISLGIGYYNYNKAYNITKNTTNQIKENIELFNNKPVKKGHEVSNNILVEKFVDILPNASYIKEDNSKSCRP